MNEPLDWLIVGGGIHGTHIALRLLNAGIIRRRLRILDPHPRLLERWRRCTANTGMTHLRSPAVHNLDVDAFALLRFAGPARHRRPGLFSAPYQRPSLDLFNRHAEALTDAHQLEELHLCGSARRIRLSCDAVHVELGDGEALACRRLVLALGVGDQPSWPAWAEALNASLSPPIAHIFAEGFSFPLTTPWRRVAVIGGGISAAQVALRLAADPSVQVTLIGRHEPKEAQFDSDPGWLGPKRLRGFKAEQDMDRRRAMIDAARHRGSMPARLVRALRRTIREGAIRSIRGEVEAASTRSSGVLLQTELASVEVDLVLLATGFAGHRPGGSLVDRLVEDHHLPCSSCGYPVVDTGLRWHPQVFVSGALAELQLGPAARNIAGARQAADAITRSVSPHDRRDHRIDAV